MNLGFTYNVRHAKPNPNDPKYILEAEFDEPATIRDIKKTLEKLGHRVFMVEANENAYLKFKKLKSKLDLVFNVSEGIFGQDREAQIPAILEMLQIPYTGPTPLVYALGLNKEKAKEVMRANHIPTPDWLTLNSAAELKRNQIKTYPVIVKPIGEGSSKGISAKNLVNNFDQLKKIVRELINKFHQSVLIEEYLTGREFTVAIIGNPPMVLPIIEITFNDLPKGMPKFDHFEAKWIYDNPKRQSDPLICPAKLTKKLEKQIREIALKAFNSLGFKDWARLDIRLDKNNKPQFIEINCPPGIIPDPKENSRFPRAAAAAGLDYETMIETIIRSACRRYKIKYH